MRHCVSLEPERPSTGRSALPGGIRVNPHPRACVSYRTIHRIPSGMPIGICVNFAIHQYSLHILTIIMNSIASSLLAELRRNGRASVSELAATLKVSRATIKSHLDRMTSDGTIIGFTVITDREPKTAAITGLITIALEGGAINRIVNQLRKSPQITTIRSTNGVWDIVIEFGVADVAALDDILTWIREMSGVVRTETSIYLRHRHG